MLTQLHKSYGVKYIPGVKIIDIIKAPNDKYKYKITVEYKGQKKSINFGDRNYEQYKDKTSLKLYSDKDHNDEKRRENYLARATAIKNKDGFYSMNDPFSANRYSIIYLW